MPYRRSFITECSIPVSATYLTPYRTAAHSSAAFLSRDRPQVTFYDQRSKPYSAVAWASLFYFRTQLQNWNTGQLESLHRLLRPTYPN